MLFNFAIAMNVNKWNFLSGGTIPFPPPRITPNIPLVLSTLDYSSSPIRLQKIDNGKFFKTLFCFDHQHSLQSRHHLLPQSAYCIQVA